MNIFVDLIRKGWFTAGTLGVNVHVRGQAHLGDDYLDSRSLAESFSSVQMT